MRILIFGDSVTQGFWDIDGGWVDRLRRSYDQLYFDGTNDDPPTVFNLGVSGDSSNELVLRFEPEIKARQNQEVAIVVAIGVNDSRSHGDKMFSNTKTYRSNLEQLLTTAQKYTKQILFVGLTPCVDSRTNPTAWGNTCYSNERLSEFDNELQSFCRESSVDFVDVLDTFRAEQEKRELLPDGLHPNGDGHKLIADLVKPNLDQLLG